MYITFRRYETDQTNASEILKRVGEGLAAFLYNAVGFVSYEVFSDEEGHICSVSMFTTRAAMEEANATAAEWVAENLEQLLPKRPLVSQGESLLEKWRAERIY